MPVLMCTVPDVVPQEMQADLGSTVGQMYHGTMLVQSTLFIEFLLDSCHYAIARDAGTPGQQSRQIV